jgi:hypothetical protein
MGTAVSIEAAEPDVAEALHQQLITAHEQLIQSMAYLADITRADAPESLEYARARLWISQAEFTRRTVFKRICDYLRYQRQADATVAELQRADAMLLQETVEHLSRWTTEQARAEWATYRTASKNLRRQIGEHVQRERAILCPLLASAQSAVRCVDYPFGESRPPKVAVG